MSPLSFRLKPSESPSFYGQQINRDRRISFTLNGHKISAYEGDTILSATLANGFYIAGTHKGYNLALDESLGICARLAAAPEVPQSALPIARTPAVDGATMLIYGAAKVGRRLPLRKGIIASLKIDFDTHIVVPPPFSELPVAQHHKVDVLIVGGGVAGMAAALEAGSREKHVLLVERRPQLGGDSILFGHADGEEDPRDAVNRLQKQLSRRRNITVVTRAEAFRFDTDDMFVHCVELRKDIPTAFVMCVTPRKTILATGCSDQQPLFPGNRLPAVSRLAETWHLAHDYAVWRSCKTLVFTSTNVAYRFATLMKDAGGGIIKIIDGRVGPHSRFLEIAKASGIKTENGVKIRQADYEDRVDRLHVETELVWDGISKAEPLMPEHLIISNGWLPRLNLWRQMGGLMAADGQATGTQQLGNIHLAGNCAGHKSLVAAEMSGVNAVRALFGVKPMPFNDEQIDPTFETPDGPLNVNTISGQGNHAPTYLAAGDTLIDRDTAPAPKGLSRLFRRRDGEAPGRLADRALGYADALAMVVLGWLPVKELENILRERAVTPRIFYGNVDSDPIADQRRQTSPVVPAYIKDRFGEGAQLWHLVANGNSAIEMGNLLFEDMGTHDPADAIGLVIRNATPDAAAVALVKRGQAGAGSGLVARGAAGQNRVTITDPAAA